jgi:hypothetical protein
MGRRVKRHLIATRSHEHGPHAESNLEQRFLHSREKSDLQSKTQGPKLDSKVLAIEPNRLLRNLAGSAIEVAQIWMPLNN